MVPPIRVQRTSPSPAPEANFAARPDFPDLVNDFVDGIGNAWQPPAQPAEQDPPGASNQQARNPSHTFDPSPSSETPSAHLEPPARAATSSSHPLPKAPPKSRPKQRCRRFKTRPTQHSAGAGNLTPPNPRVEVTLHAHTSNNRTNSKRQSNHRHHPNKENLPLRTDNATAKQGHTSKSRCKRKCTFGPKRKNETCNALDPAQLPSTAPDCPPTPQEPTSLDELDALLAEIDNVRQKVGDPFSQQPEITETAFDEAQGKKATLSQTNLASSSYKTPPRSRKKVKCKFGPLKRRGRNSFQPPTSCDFTPSHDDGWPTPDPPVVIEERPSTVATHEASCSSFSCDRVTLAPFSTVRRSFMDIFKASVEPAPQPNPHRFKLRALGITQEEFDIQVAREVDEALAELTEERRRERDPSPPVEPPLIPLSKEDCLRHFRTVGYPNTDRVMMGVWRWAVDLGRTRFNFDWDWEKYDINLLNAYD